MSRTRCKHDVHGMDCVECYPAPTVSPALPKRQTALALSNQNVQKVRNLQNLVESIYRQVQDVKAITLHNFNLGVRMGERSAYDPPFDYKLNQLDDDVTTLRDMFCQFQEGKAVEDEGLAIEVSTAIAIKP